MSLSSIDKSIAILLVSRYIVVSSSATF